MAPVSIGGNAVAFSATSAAVYMHNELLKAVDQAITGDYSYLERVVGIIESWKNSPNPEERKAYRIFMRAYKKTYEQAREILLRRGRKVEIYIK